jgi:prevent-host-death family protein
MPLIKPVSDLRNYPEVLKGVKVGQPVYLTKNGKGRYVLIDIEDYSVVESATRLGMELMRGRIPAPQLRDVSTVIQSAEWSFGAAFGRS